MHMSSYLLPFLDTGIDDICIYLSTLTDIPYLHGEKLSMKTFFLVVDVVFHRYLVDVCLHLHKLERH